MVNVNKPIAKGEGSVQSTPRRRPRNQELNSSKKSKHTKRRSLNSSLATGLDRLIGEVKSSDAQDYYEKFKVMQTNPAYEEELMADAYYKAEQMLSEKLGVPNVMLETSVQNGRGSVDAWADGGTGEHLASYDFEDESNAIWDIIKNWSGDTNGLVDAVAEKIVDFVSTSTDVDSSCGDKADVDSSKKLNCDASGISGAQDLLQKFVEDAASKYRTNLTLEWKPYSWKWSPEKKEIQYVIHEKPETEDGDYTMSRINWSPSAAKEFVDSVNTFIQKTVIPYLVDNAPEVDCIHGLFDDSSSYLQLGDFSTDAPDIDRNDYDEELDSAKDSDESADITALNSSAESEGDTDGEDAIGEGSEESAMITTESGNEVSISDIQIIQNPDTNELSLFIKEDEDEEIPEGFVVIATATQAALPTGDTCPNCGQEPCVCEGEGELDSSKKKN